MARHCVCSKNTIFSYLAQNLYQDPYYSAYYHNKIFTQNSFFFFAGVKGGPLYNTTRAWFNLLRFIVGNMKNGKDKFALIYVTVFHVVHYVTSQVEPGSSGVV